MVVQPLDEVKVFAPASVSNFGPGFDVFGMAVNHPGDMVVARRSKKEGVRIISIMNDEGILPIEAHKNTAGIAADRVLRLLGSKEGVDLEIHKGMPSQSGLGSSGASAAAAAYAVNVLYGALLSKEELVGPCMEAEAGACGAPHADNVAPSLLGGFLAVWGDPPKFQVYQGIEDLAVSLVHPNIDVSTKAARASLPRKIEIGLAAKNWGSTAVMSYCFARGDLRGFCDALHDPIVEPHRAKFIPRFNDIREAALGAGAWACSISGSGPTMFAIVPSKDLAEAVGASMQAVFTEEGIVSQVYATSLNPKGAVAIQ